MNQNPWGTDLALIIGPTGALDIDATSRLSSGIQTLAQSLVMRQTTPTGSLIGAENDCFDVRQWLSAGKTPSEINQLQAAVQSQLLRDQRVIMCNVQASYDLASSTLKLIESIQSSLGPFTLTLTVSQVAVTMLVGQ